jgi:MFS transporter, SET family, sugar efflux transporter
MNAALHAMRQRAPDATLLAFLAVAFLSGTASALQVPTLSLFLSEQVGARPVMIGLFYTVNAMAGIVVSQWLSHRSDLGGSRRRLIVLCCLAGFAGCVLFAFDRHYLVLITVGVLLGSLGGTANPQVFALAREHTDRLAREAGMFNAILRAQISLAWVIGPPIAFALAIGYGFATMYLCAGLAFIAGALLVGYRLPASPPRTGKTATGSGFSSAVRLPFLTSTLMWTCNGMYLIAMPLYVTRTLGLPAHTAGILMGTAAGLEIPVMLLAGRITGRIGKRPLIRISAVAGVVFYLGMCAFRLPAVLLALQLANAIFIGIIASIGMLYFQDLMPDRIGTASTLFATSTRTGSIIAGAISGAIIEYGGYHAVMYANLAFAILALASSLRLRSARPSSASCPP